jgi:hypothetical protein
MTAFRVRNIDPERCFFAEERCFSIRSRNTSASSASPEKGMEELFSDRQAGIEGSSLQSKGKICVPGFWRPPMKIRETVP